MITDPCDGVDRRVPHVHGGWQIACRRVRAKGAVVPGALVYSSDVRSALRRSEREIERHALLLATGEPPFEAPADANSAAKGVMDRIDPPAPTPEDPFESSNASDGSPAGSSGGNGAGANGAGSNGAGSNDRVPYRSNANGARSSRDGRARQDLPQTDHVHRDGARTAISGGVRPGPVCRVCPLRSSCRSICEVVEALLPSPERGRVDAEDLPRLFSGIRMRRALLDMSHILTERQQEVVRLYYRESLQQHEIAERLGVTQQAVHDSLRRARKTVGERILQGGRNGDRGRRPAN